MIEFVLNTAFDILLGGVTIYLVFREEQIAAWEKRKFKSIYNRMRRFINAFKKVNIKGQGTKKYYKKNSVKCKGNLKVIK